MTTSQCGSNKRTVSFRGPSSPSKYKIITHFHKYFMRYHILCLLICECFMVESIAMLCMRVMRSIKGNSKRVRQKNPQIASSTHNLSDMRVSLSSCAFERPSTQCLIKNSRFNVKNLLTPQRRKRETFRSDVRLIHREWLGPSREDSFIRDEKAQKVAEIN